MKNKIDHIETSLESTCSSTMQFLEYDLNVVGTHKIKDGVLVSKTNGTLEHRDVSAEYKEDGKYQTLQDWEEEVHLDITSPTFTSGHLYYHIGENNYTFSAAFPAIGTVALDSENDNDTLKWNFYYRPQVWSAGQ